MFDPAKLIGCPLPQAMDQLVGLAPEELWPQGRVDLHSRDTAPEPVTSRPIEMMATTVGDAELPLDHPHVRIPGVCLDQFLGGGGQGWVYAGKVLETGKIVAVKILRSDYVVAKGWAAREAMICSRVRHPNILRVFEAQQAGDFWVVLMEMIPGSPLGQGTMTMAELRRCLCGIADALQALDRSHIVHCDIKPGNILLRRQSGTPVLVDFGIACDLRQPQESTALFGTPFYLAPEAFSTRQPHAGWDAYALGVTAASVLGYQRSYTSMQKIRADKLSGVFDNDLMSAMQRMSDAALGRWIVSLIQKDPADRLEALAATAERLAA